MQRNPASISQDKNCTCSYVSASESSRENTFQAGTAGQNNSCAEDYIIDTGCPLATAFFANQVYTYAFCPDTALEHGTLFPTLVRPWMKEV